MTSKVVRKSKRVANKVSEEFGLRVSVDEELLSEHLLLCNIGVTTGVSREEVVELIQAQGVKPKSVQFLPGKSFSFASFSHVNDALKVFRILNGKSPSSQSFPTVPYLAFVDKVPKSSNVIWERMASKQYPPGVNIIEDFVSVQEEANLMDLISFPKSGNDLKNRQVMHYGYDFVYGSNSIDKSHKNPNPFPEQWIKLLKSAKEKNYISQIPDQCTVNRYKPGQGIPSHIDTHSCCSSEILSISLGSDIVMNFTHPNGEDHPVILPRKSLLIMAGEARYVYKHGIATRLSDIIPIVNKNTNELELSVRKRDTRVSLTFRKTLDGPCTCNYSNYCDSKTNNDLSTNNAKELEANHVHAVYENIAEHFSETRHKAWPRVMQFLDSLPKDGILFDIGCGNGKYLGHHPLQFQIGCDYSQSLSKICHTRGFNGTRSDCLHLPFKDDIADGVICIAVIHHLSTKERRIQALQEICRVLKPNGRGLIYAWAKDQKKNEKPSSYLKQSRQNRLDEANVKPEQNISFPESKMVLPVHKNRTDFLHSDVLVPWKMKGGEEKVFHRFYHVFEEHELESLIKNVSELNAEETYYDQGNWCCIFRKK